MLLGMRSPAPAISGITTSGFTMVEMIVVISIIALMMAMMFPVMSSMRERSRVSGTATLVHAVVTTIVSASQQSLTVTESTGKRIYRIWDVNHDGLVDGSPALENTVLSAAEQYTAAVVASGYKGLYAATGMSLPKRNFDETTGRIVDAWRRPLRIVFSEDVRYGSPPTAHVAVTNATAFADPLKAAGGIGVWSAGKDGADEKLDDPAKDDIRTWENVQ